jgi:hypothetical protein
MKFSLHMPDEWRELLDVAREEAGLASTQEFVRRILKNAPELRAAWVKMGCPPMPELGYFWGVKSKKRRVTKPDTLINADWNHRRSRKHAKKKPTTD